MESIAVLHESTVSHRLKSSCLTLFKEAVEGGKNLKGRANQIWSEAVNRLENIESFFQSEICKEIQHEFQLDDRVMRELLQLIQVSEKISGVKTLADFIQLVSKGKKSAYFDCQSFVLLVEQCLLKKMILEATLLCYCRIIKEGKCCKVKECLKMLVEHFCENEPLVNVEDYPKIRLFEAMYYATKFVQLPGVCIKFVVNNLDNSNEIIRGYAFGMLKTYT